MLISKPNGKEGEVKVMSKWILTDEIRNGIAKDIISFIEQHKDLSEGDERTLNLYNKGISPAQFEKLMGELEYGEPDCETNGWQWYFWHTFTKEGAKRVLLSGCGYTFDIMMTVKG